MDVAALGEELDEGATDLVARTWARTRGMLEITRRCRRIATRDRALRQSVPMGARRADSEDCIRQLETFRPDGPL